MCLDRMARGGGRGGRRGEERRGESGEEGEGPGATWYGKGYQLWSDLVRAVAVVSYHSLKRGAVKSLYPPRGELSLS